MNTKILEYIAAIAEEQSVTRAAERFYLSHAALSRHLRNLETELGRPLFERTPSGMQLTPAGRIFLSDARAILHLEQKLTQALTDMRKQRQRTLPLLVDIPFYNRFVAAVLPQFAALHPDYTLDLRKCNAAEACDALRRGTGLLGTFLAPDTGVPGLVCLPFYHSRLRLVFPGGHSGRTDLQGLRDALDSGVLLSGYPAGHTVRMLTDQELSARQIYPSRVIEGDSRTIISHAVSLRACCILPEYFCPLAEQSGLIVGEEFCSIHHVLAYASRTVLSPAAQDLMQIVIRAFSDS